MREQGVIDARKNNVPNAPRKQDAQYALADAGRLQLKRIAKLAFAALLTLTPDFSGLYFWTGRHVVE